MTTPEDDQDADDHLDYNADLHALALRLILSGLRLDNIARDQVLDEIGDCPGCQRAVMLMLVCEACSALVPDEDDNGETTESAINYVSAILTDVLDTCEQERLDHDCEGDGEPPE